jgi:hypothetical protein
MTTTIKRSYRAALGSAGIALALMGASGAGRHAPGEGMRETS